MAHTSEKRWGDVSGQVSAAAQNVRDSLLAAEEVFQQMNELYAFTGSTTQGLADQLFFEFWSTRRPDPVGAPDVFETEANASEVAKAQDAIDAMTSLHELYQAATNVATAQEDRILDLRRMI